ncbi:MAG: exodeoxyribonuclease VII large subunit [Woeseiaceae bacterium]|jgi:exodeoxyribonuclease VII large subunit|nr:exodeoxyribonuclease VII large subunit [Woeseiaceae bacterium]
MQPNTPITAAISVSQLNRRVKTLIEQGMTRLWVEGEISNLSRPASGHMYLSLKDNSAQVSAAWFRSRQRKSTINFKNGDRVLAFGRVSLYEPRGNYQLIIEELEPAGEGILKRRFDELKLKLANEGLFDEDRKQALPELPTRIGIITSPSGAAIRDVLSILGRRFPAVPVVIYPATVQGDAAPNELLNALSTAIHRNECDVLILCRGGGSIEDLWAFNNETLARAISDCTLPIISAIGHETDFTIADFVADIRAPTPSGAAEIIVPNQDDWLRQISNITTRITRIGQRALDNKTQELDWLSRRLVVNSPAAKLQQQRQSLREQCGRLNSAIRQQLLEQKNELQSVGSELITLSPALSVQQSIANLQQLRQRLATSIKHSMSDTGHKIALLGRSLNSVSPIATLDRGYAIVKDNNSGKVILSSSEVKAGEDIRARLSQGELIATIKKVISND